MLVGICCCNVGQCTVAFLLVCKCKVGQFKKQKQKVVAGVGKLRSYSLSLSCVISNCLTLQVQENLLTCISMCFFCG